MHTEQKQITDNISTRQLITDNFRNKILTNQLPAGSKLPSTQEIATCFNTRVANAQRAISILAKEGLVMRKPRLGTIVSEQKKKFRRVAVYICCDLRDPGNNYSRLILKYLEQELRFSNVECLPIFENRENAGLQYISELAEKQQIQGIIAPVLPPEALKAIKLMNAPFACAGSGGTVNRIGFDLNSLIEKSFDAFQELNCRNVAILTLMPSSVPSDKRKDTGTRQYHQTIDKAAAKKGLTILPEWRVCAPGNPELTVDQYGRFAYDGFRKIWSSPHKPEGLFVHTDDLIQGVLLALLKAKLSVPDDLKLVMHHNAEIPIICPIPCVFIENSIQELAKQLVLMVKNLYSGKTATPLNISYQKRYHHGDD